MTTMVSGSPPGDGHDRWWAFGIIVVAMAAGIVIVVVIMAG